jgi:hypothetical protein
VAVGVGVRVFVGVLVLVDVKVGEFAFTVGVAVNVGVGVKVGVQQSTSRVTQFDAMLAMLGPPIRAWFEMGTQPDTFPHQVNEPEVIETLPKFQVTGLVDEQPLHPW